MAIRNFFNSITHSTDNAAHPLCTVCESNPATVQLHNAYTNPQTGTQSAIHKACGSCTHAYLASLALELNTDKYPLHALTPCFAGCTNPLDFNLINDTVLHALRMTDERIQYMRSQPTIANQHAVARHALHDNYKLDALDKRKNKAIEHIKGITELRNRTRADILAKNPNPTPEREQTLSEIDALTDAIIDISSSTIKMVDDHRREHLG